MYWLHSFTREGLQIMQRPVLHFTYLMTNLKQLWKKTTFLSVNLKILLNHLTSNFSVGIFVLI